MQQTNRGNLSTSADGADIFDIGQAGARFTNLGNLATSGNLASPIRISADGVTITNKGTLSTIGNGSSAIVAGDPFGNHYDDVTIVNYGTISTSGGIFDDGVSFGFSDGIDVFGNHARVLNYGSIAVADPELAGIYSIGKGSIITNSGQIDAVKAGIMVDWIDHTETNNMLTNFGRIHTTGDGSRGIWVLTDDNSVRNGGTIQADGVHSYGIYLEGDNNRAQNTGTILVTGQEGRGIALQGEHLTFDNYGTVRTTGVDSIGVRMAGENQLGTDSGTFTNYGKIQSAGWAVLGADSDDHVLNRGAMAGIVDLGAGNDSYLAGKGGSLAGVLTLGDGNDVIVFEKGGGSLTVADFTPGAGSDDVIDLSAFGYHSFDEVMAHAAQSGSDVVLQLGPKDQIVLQNVALGSLAADDFALASAALPAPVLHVLHGDHLFG